MLFNSIPFVILVLVTLVIYYLPLMRRHQVLVLVAASFVFYAWERPILLLLLLASILINVVTSYFIAVDKVSRQRLWAVLGVTLNLGLLLFFKYSPLFAKTFMGGDASSIGHFLITLPLPIGISFFTFQGISLVVEVFRDQQHRKAGKAHTEPPVNVPRNFMEHLRNTALFKAFFPYLIAGPIVKAHEFYPQIGPKKFRDIHWEAAFRALTIGYFLKMVIADNMKDATFWIEYPFFMNDSGLALAALLFGYSMQIFADFAGYSLIAIGLGYLFGYVLPTNFNFPYISRSFSEFWTRWHISLSTWLREYLYIPLGGNRKGKLRTYLNLFIVMFLGGLWHGAAWSYAVWGTFHGTALAVERLVKNRIRFPNHWISEVFRVLVVFSFVTLAWLLFKLPRIEHVFAYLNVMFRNYAATRYLIVACVLTYSAPVIAYYAWHLLKRQWGPQMQKYEFLLLGALLVGIALNSGSPQKFIYFQF
jgi:alginate O-acetyltransferase complex protein AlgI